jgi:biopolymer transport protein ExbD
MKLRNRVTTGKVNVDMTPMIDVVFQLLIFFMCTLKVIEPEGDFDISMPLGAPSASSDTEAELPPFKVRLEANAEGELNALYFNGANLGGGEQAFAKLNSEVFRAITALAAIGPDQQEKQEVEIDPDYNVHYRYIISSIGACSGRLGQNGIPVRYISKIKFAPRREPQ